MGEGSTPPYRVLIVDDHEIVRMGLVSLFATDSELEVVGQAATAEEAVEAAARLKPQVVLMDVRLPDRSGVEACREIRAAIPGTRVLFLTSFEDESAVLATIMSGADGYLLKEVGGAALIRAIKMVGQGQPILDPGVARQMLDRLRRAQTAPADPQRAPLSRQEERVLALVAEGKTNKEIGLALGLSSKTVKNYLSTVYQKLDVRRRSEATARYLRDLVRR